MSSVRTTTLGCAAPVQARSQVRAFAPNLRHLRHACAVGMLVLVGATLLLRLPQPISGSDGGNWLTLSDAFLGIRANAASTVYLPGFLVVLLAFRAVAAPVEALRLAAISVALLQGLGCYVLLRALGARWLALCGALFPLFGYSSEMVAWGGYPQLLGNGLTTVACAVLLRALATSRLRFFAAAGLLAGLAVDTHPLAGFQAVITFAVTSGVVLLAEPRAWRTRVVQWAITAGMAAAVIAPSLPVYFGLLTRAGPSAFNAQEFPNLGEMVQYLTYDAPIVWPLLGVCVPLAIVSHAVRRDWYAVSALIGLAAASVGLTLVTFEVRALALALLLAFVSTVLVFADLLAVSERRWSAPLALTAGALLVTLTIAGQQRLDTTTRYYSQLDPSVIQAMEWLRTHARPDDLAVSTAVRQTWPLGWWVQGLGRVPSYLDYDQHWLYFREEKQQADIARAIVATADPQAAAVRAQEYGVTLLVFDVRDTGMADQWLHSGRVFGSIGLIYTNPSVAIFRVDRPG